MEFKFTFQIHPNSITYALRGMIMLALHIFKLFLLCLLGKNIQEKYKWQRIKILE